MSRRQDYRNKENMQSKVISQNINIYYTRIYSVRLYILFFNNSYWYITTGIGGRDGCEGPHDDDKMEHICGRPLGLCFDTATGDLYIADAYMGLLVVGPDGGMATKVATRIPLGFTNGLDIDHRNGVVYFSDSSSQYQRRYVILILHIIYIHPIPAILVKLATEQILLKNKIIIKQIQKFFFLVVVKDNITQNFQWREFNISIFFYWKK